jgi:carboxypeptidase family protein
VLLIEEFAGAQCAPALGEVFLETRADVSTLTQRRRGDRPCHLLNKRIGPEARRITRAAPAAHLSHGSIDANRPDLRARSRVGALLSIVSLLILLPCSLVGSQSLDVVLRGKVSSETGLGLAGATVTAIDEATGVVRAADADGQGYFVMLNLPAGTYRLRAELDGFSPETLRAQTLHVGTTVATNFSLKVAGVAESIEVRGILPALETSKNTVARIVQIDEIDALPVINRNFNDLAALAPAVSATGGASTAAST